MHKIIVVTLTVSVSLFAQAGGTWTSTTGGDIRSDANYSDGTPGTSDDLYFANTQSAAITASGDVQVGRILFYKKTNSYKTFKGDLDLGAGRSLLAATEVFVSHGAKVHLRSGHLGIALDATAPTRNSYICSENDDGNELTIDGPNSRFTVSLAKGMQMMRRSSVARQRHADDAQEQPQRVQGLQRREFRRVYARGVHGVQCVQQPDLRH